ncbi:MAG: TonB-dependent receptor [Rhodocyclales bacterium]|nr:TonB-dependent receptor [Rhodocyclales bacterium]
MREKRSFYGTSSAPQRGAVNAPKDRLTRPAAARHGALPMAVGIAIAGLLLQPARAANPAEILETPTVEIIGTSPLPGLGTPLRDVPANVQIFTSRELGQQRQTNVGDYLEQNPTGVTINSAQGNPFQSDVNYRGFSASPVLGTPQGISVFQDGVRINEPFGDVVNWDLIPQSAISSIQLIPGSNPAFGLNTLGGALALYTKSGSDYPGGAIETYAGSFGRKGVEFEFGGKKDSLDYFFTGNHVSDHGWAEHNPSTVRQFFGKVGWQDEKTDFDLSLTLVDNTLQGTQTLPVSFLDNIRQPYTFPDKNNNKLTLLTAKGSRFLTDAVLLGGNLYYRKYRNDNFSSNVNGNFDPVLDPVQATNDRSTIDQDSYGLGLQLTVLGQIAQRENRFTFGTSADLGKARFSQDSQQAAFTAQRGTVGTSAFEVDTDAGTSNRYYGVFFTDTLNLNKEWALTASGRYNRARVKIEDLTGSTPELNGEHTFSRFNTAAGINFTPGTHLTAYAAYNEGMRAPTPIELACADPAAPCKLPNNFLADPPLKMVVSRTLEAGLRGKLSKDSHWSAAIYRTELTDDIQFVSSGGAVTNAGYFQNVGKTLRQGLELGINAKRNGFAASVRYSYVKATFESPFELNSPGNSTADGNGAIQVQPGSRLTGVPQHSLKLRLQYDFGDQASLGTNILYSSSVFARGDENNQDVNGRIPGYAVVNLDGRYALAKGLDLFARVANLFDRRYANFGLVGANFFAGPGRTFAAASPVNEQFRGPGVPRGAWVGLRYQWD